MAVVYDTQCCRKLSVLFLMYLGFTSTLMINMFYSMIRRTNIQTCFVSIHKVYHSQFQLLFALATGMCYQVLQDSFLFL